MIKRLPILLPFLGFLSGILIAGFQPIESFIIWIVSGICFLFLALLLTIPKARTWHAILIISMLLGVLCTALQNERLAPSHYVHLDSQRGYYTGVLNDPPKPTKNAIRLCIDVKETRSNGPLKITGKVFLYVPNNSIYQSLVSGDCILFHAQLEPATKPKNPNEFDYKNYLNLHQIYWQGYSERIKVLESSEGFNAKIDRVRNNLLNIISKLELSNEEKSVAAALLLGYRYDLSTETEQAFAGAGAMHVLAVSGLHVGILYLITAFILKLDKRKRNRNNIGKVILVILIIWIYAVLTGLSPSVSRAALMFTFVSIGAALKRQPSTYQAILSSAFLLLVINPNNLFEVGFQLSYAAVLGILFIQPKLYYLLEFKFMIFDKIWAITTVSIAAQLATFPLGIYYFHQFPVLFLVSNLIVIPAAYLLMCNGIIILLIGSFSTVPLIILWPFKTILWVMIKTVHVVETIPYSVLGQLTISRFELVMLMCLVFGFIATIFLKKKSSLYISGITSLLLLISITWRYEENMNTRSLTFYSIKDQFAVFAQDGNEGHFIADRRLLDDESKMRFHVKHHIWASGARTSYSNIRERINEYDISIETGLFDIMSKRVLLYNSTADSLKFSLRPDIICLTSNVQPPKTVPVNTQILLQNGLKKEIRANWVQFENCKDLTDSFVEFNLNAKQ